MIKAGQSAVIQNTNSFLVQQIRALELNYYSSWYMAFGNQAILLAGFVLSSYSQVLAGDSGSKIGDRFGNLYWITITITFCASIHCALITLFSYVYGNGLALRGPEGSVVRAVDGMVSDRSEVFLSYVVAVVAFVVSTMATYWIVMTHEIAGLTCLLNIVGFAYTYSCCLRIYNRFKYVGITSSSVPWTEGDDDGGQEDLSAKIGLGKGQKNTSAKKDRQAKSSTVIKPRRSYITTRFFGGRGLKQSPASSFSDTESVADDLDKASKQIRIAGYLTVRKAALDSSAAKSTGAWERRYSVMVRSELYFYSSEIDFARYPEKPSSMRPLDMSGYTVVGFSVEPPYHLTLASIDPDDNRRSWEFRCDTVAEIKEWSKAMTEINYCSAAFAIRKSILRSHNHDGSYTDSASDRPDR